MIKQAVNEQTDPLEILREEAKAAALCYGLELSDEFAINLVKRYSYRLGGVHVYFPRKSMMMRKNVAAEIRTKFNGNNLRELAKEYALSVRHVRRLINDF